MVPRIPCELSELASDNPPINIKAHSKVRAFCFALIILLSCVWLRHPIPAISKLAATNRVLRILSTLRPGKNVSDSWPLSRDQTAAT
jgi:hypothetical protein